MTITSDSVQDTTPAPQFMIVSDAWHGWTYVELPVQDTAYKPS